MIDDEVGAHTRVTVLAYWKLESVSLQRRVNELSVPLDEGVFEPSDLLQTLSSPSRWQFLPYSASMKM